MSSGIIKKKAAAITLLIVISVAGCFLFLPYDNFHIFMAFYLLTAFIVIVTILYNLIRLTLGEWQI